MQFTRVDISDFRNLDSVSFTPSTRFNLIIGDNGSGKSSLLEALYFLGTGSSYRTHRLPSIIQKEKDCFTLFSSIRSDANNHLHKIGLKRCRNLNHNSRVNGEEIKKRSQLFQILPLQILSPESLSLLIDGSEKRRNFLDWHLFHVEQSFHYHLSHYNRALKQRNALLKSQQISDISYWNSLLIKHGLIIDQLRREYIDLIQPYFFEIAEQLLPDTPFQISYRSGWTKGSSLEQSLLESVATDCRVRHTTVGPHRADFILRSDGSKAIDILSRGQLKLAVVSLKLAQIMLFKTQARGNDPVILIDDLAAELDHQHRLLLLQWLSRAETQIFVTTPDVELIKDDSWEDKKVFHVEHGKVQEVV